MTKILPSPICPVLARRIDRIDRRFDHFGADGDFDLELGQEAHGVLGAAIDLGVTLLAAVAFDLGNGHALHAERGQRLAHLFELERFDDRRDELHG